jgi:hypothetical protein
MDYQQHYDQLMARARTRSLTGYKEQHHVFPRCLGGTDDAANLVYLTPEEHYVAHQLLVKIYPGDHRLIWAAVNMTGATKQMAGRKNKLYGWLRRRLAEKLRERARGRKHSEAARAKMSASRLGKQRGPHSADHKAKLSAAHKARKRTPEHNAALAAAKRGKKRGPHNPTWRAHQYAGLMRVNDAIDRSFTQTPEYKALQGERMREIWAQRRAGELPMPVHPKSPARR